jgi:LCP family protein required for cell wall assembly
MRLGPILTLLIVLLMIPVTACGSYFAYTQSRTRVEELNEITPLNETDFWKVVRLSIGIDDVDDIEAAPTSLPDVALVDNATPTAISTLAGGDASAQQTQTPVPGETQIAEVVPNPAQDIQIDPRRVTILLMGIDQRQGEQGPFRTDTMIVLSIDPVGRTGAMLSIPRDLWVSIPGQGTEGRINTANFVGDSPDVSYPGGGPALAMLTVERLLGVPIDHYILVNFDAFITAVDTVGPIEICPSERIDDPRYPDGAYGYMPVVIEMGCQQMDAELLLKYARTRATSGGDFDRAQRQQEVILAVRDKILSTGGITALLGDAFTIWESVSANVRTDLTLDEMIELGLAASEINDIRKGTISTGEVLEGTGPDGSQILIPIQTDIFALVSDLFRPPNVPAAALVADQATPDPENVPLNVREEAPIIALMNGTAIQGRARNLQAFVLSYNLDVDFVGNHINTDVVQTSITYYGDHADSAAYLADVLATINGNNRPPVQRGDGTRDEGDVIVIIGTDLAVPQLVDIE